MNYKHEGITDKTNHYIVVMTRNEEHMLKLKAKWVGHGDKFFYCQLDKDELGQTGNNALKNYVQHLRAKMPGAFIDLIDFRQTTFLSDVADKQAQP
ncbi:MAG: hypothetical protein EOO38_00305 [Cytophagaceae bacterium]|nr:MAG: hypothetical protein EOO38_00305 [Cytophagaceae bacterium]